MTEVWKSNPRKFCELCKVWFADNKVSIEHHESGLKHKNAIQMKLRELGKQNKANQEKELALHATIAQMEAAAVMSILNEGSTKNCAAIGPSTKPKKSKSYMDPRAHSSVTAMAKEMAKRKKEATKALVKKSQHWKDSDDDEDDGEQVDDPMTEKERKDEVVWTEAKTDAGLPYYFHIYSGETVWETPKRYYTAKQYAARLNEIDTDAMAHGSNAQPRTVTAPRRAWGLKPENKASHSIKETKQNRATRRAHLAGTKQPGAPKPKTAPESTDHAIDPWLSFNMAAPPPPPQFYKADSTDPSQQGVPHEQPEVSTSPMGIEDIPTPGIGVAEASDEHPSIPYEEGAAVAASFRLEDHDIPLPPPPQDPAVEQPRVEADIARSSAECVDTPISDEMSYIKREPEDEGDIATGSEETATTTAIPTDDVDKEPEETEKVHPFFHRPAPFGEWRKVTKPVEQPNVDYELPTEEEGRVAKPQEVIRPEDVVVFEEKTAPLSHKKKKKDAPITFKKRKTTINARKRDGD